MLGSLFRKPRCGRSTGVGTFADRPTRAVAAKDAAISGVEVAAFSRPADIIGGDYFDFFQFRDGTHGLRSPMRADMAVAGMR
ncbi:MAG: hypothetical protein U0X87_13505 [Anaerolineales bacterium]